MSHREIDAAAEMRRLWASLNDDIADAKSDPVVRLELVRLLTIERDKVIADLQTRETVYP